MESGLLNAFHDDQFDGNYVKYDNNFWSDENNSTIGLQLSETLHGILPISPTDDQHIYYSDDIETQYSVELHENDLENDIYGTKNKEDILFSNYNENDVISSSPSIEIIPVDPNCDFNVELNELDNSEFDDNDDDDDDDSDSENNDDIIESNSNKINQNLAELRTYSRSTFRSRTDSSSIGDYESHSSDESDYSESDNLNNIIINQPIFNEFNNVENYLNSTVQKDTKNCFKKSIKNLNNLSKIFVKNEIDESLFIDQLTENKALISNIDKNNFNLEKYLSKDDYVSEELIVTSSSNSEKTCETNSSSDIETDFEIDIETINDCENANNNLILKKQKYVLPLQNNSNIFFMEDDIKNDPSWNPTSLKSITNNKVKNVQKLKQQSKGIRNVQKEFSETLKRNQSMINKSPQSKKFGIGRGGKNISMCIKQESLSSQDEKDDKNLINLIVTNSITPESTKIEKNLPNDTENLNKSNPVRKKLNLEEYKRRNLSTPYIKNSIKISNTTNSIKSLENNNSHSQNEKSQSSQINCIIEKKLDNIKLCNEINLKNNINIALTSNKIILDPITEAKNKVLRMQELKKKAAEKRLIDFTVSSKVGPITKILPLEEMVNSTKKLNKNDKQKLNSEYEEIICVSVSCNTDIRIPPIVNNSNSSNNLNLSKSAELLYKVSNTIQKVTATDSTKISNNSLISSIQNVVFKKTFIASNEDKILFKTNEINESQNNKNILIEQQHGEDKVIMHLTKNRIRKSACSISTQTNILPEFPPLELILDKINRKHINKPNNDKNKSKYRSRKQAETSDDDDCYGYNFRGRSRSPNLYNHRLISTDRNHDLTTYKNGSCSTATSSSESDRDRHSRNRNRNRRIGSSSPNRSERSRSGSSSTSSSNKSHSRNRSVRRSRSRSRYSYDRQAESRRNERSAIPAVEERRIVYVGRIEAETSKEDLKRKFLSYGPIKLITLHYKDTGMKYGFVTFEKAEDAFKSIDNGMKDPKINMYDISFGGRRAFCRATYSDLDGAATNTFQTYSSYSLDSQSRPKSSIKQPDDSFETLLKKMKEKLSGAATTTKSRVKI